MPKVWNARDPNRPKDAILVDRTTCFGNPYRLRKGLHRDTSIYLFRSYVDTNPVLIRLIKTQLRGKDLVCWCSPKSCHADVLLEIANS